jgi:hypothetical protein
MNWFMDLLRNGVAEIRSEDILVFWDLGMGWFFVCIVWNGVNSLILALCICNGYIISTCLFEE